MDIFDLIAFSLPVTLGELLQELFSLALSADANYGHPYACKNDPTPGVMESGKVRLGLRVPGRYCNSAERLLVGQGVLERSSKGAVYVIFNDTLARLALANGVSQTTVTALMAKVTDR